MPDGFRRGRRETWDETVARYFDFFGTSSRKARISCFSKGKKELENAVLNLGDAINAALMTAGEAQRDNVAGYNCSYVAVNRLRAFDEILYVLMCGTGVGFSVG